MTQNLLRGQKNVAAIKINIDGNRIDVATYISVKRRTVRMRHEIMVATSTARYKRKLSQPKSSLMKLTWSQRNNPGRDCKLMIFRKIAK